MRTPVHASPRPARRALAGVAASAILVISACSSGSDAASTSSDDASDASGETSDIRRFDGETLTIAGYSSTFNDVWAESFGAYFEERTGVTVRWLESTPAQAISRVRASGGSPDIDIFFADTANLAQAINADAVGEINPDNIPNLADVAENLRLEHGVPSMFYRYGSCYNTEQFEELGLDAPSTSDAWFDPQLEGRTMLPSSTASQWLITIPAFARSLGHEVNDAQATAEDLAALNPYGFFNASGDMDAAMTSGDVWLTLGNNQGRCLALRDQGVPVDYAGWEMELDGQQYTDVLNPDNLVMTNGTEKQEIVELFMNEYLSAEAAEATVPLWQFIAGTPPTEAARTTLLDADETASEYIVEDSTSLFLPDYLAVVPSLQEWNNAWNGLLS